MDTVPFWDLFLIAACTGAVTGALITSLFNVYIMNSRKKWDKRQYIIELSRELCQELMVLTAHYNQMNPMSSEAKILSAKITAQINLIAKFIDDNLIQDEDIQKAMKSVMSLTEGNFATATRLADTAWAAKSVHTITQLHLSLLNAKLKNTNQR